MRNAIWIIAWLGLAGCRSVSPYVDPTALGQPQVVPWDAFNVDWTTPLVPPSLLEFAPREIAAPAVDEGSGRVVVLTRNGVIHLLSPTGEELWHRNTRLGFNAGPAISDGVAYVPGSNGILYAFDVRNVERDEKLLWTYDAKEELSTTPTVYGDHLYVASEMDSVFALEAKTGKWRWQYRRDLPSGFTIRGTSTPVEKDGTVWMGFADGALVALNAADGTVRMERQLSGAGSQFLDVDTTAQFDQQGNVFAASYQNGLFAYNSKTGEQKWHTAAPGITSLTLSGEVLFAAGDRRAAAFNARTGQLLWTMNLGDRFARQPMVAKGMLLLPTENALRFVEPRVGRTRISWNPGQGISAPPFLQGGKLYVLSNLGYIYALRLMP